MIVLPPEQTISFSVVHACVNFSPSGQSVRHAVQAAAPVQLQLTPSSQSAHNKNNTFFIVKKWPTIWILNQKLIFNLQCVFWHIWRVVFS